MLDPNLRAQLADHLGRLEHPVVLTATLDASAASDEVRSLVESLVGLSPKLSIAFDPAVEGRRPLLSVARAGQAARVRFAGAPLGHEFTSFVLALLQAGGVPPRIDAPTVAVIRSLPPAHLETFVSLECHNCPEVVQALGALAALHPGITHEMVDGGVFEAEVKARGLLGVPAVFKDGQLLHSGRATLAELIAKLDAGAADRQAAALDARAPYDVLVVGGGPAGASAAIYAARKGIRVGLVAERFGGQVGDTLGIENLISVAYTEGPKLVAALEQQVRAQGVEVVTGEKVVALEPGEAGRHTLRLANGAALRARSVVLAPGARWREMQVPGEAEYKTRGVVFCPHCDGPLFKGQRVAVVGGGNSGVEAALDLAGIASHVTLLELGAELRADAVLRDRLAALRNVTVSTRSRPVAVEGDGARVTGLAYQTSDSDERRTLDVAGVFVQIGLVPSTDWLRGTVALSPRGEIEVDTRGQTSLPGVFAAGDATTVPFKQIVVAMGEGAKASLGAFEGLLRATPRAV